MKSFDGLGLAEPITRALNEARYLTPTPIQSSAIPLVLAGRDLIGIAQTGTGKTAAFALPILHHLANRSARPEPKSARVLILTPTRELASQILQNFETYGRYLSTSAKIAIGGVPIGKQIRALAHGVDVLVATPGRLMDLQRSRAVRLDRVEVMVLDEADRMLDMGFIRDIKAIVAQLPRERQMLFFSATMPSEIARLADGMLNKPEKVSVTPVSSTAERIAQQVAHVERSAKPAFLAAILKKEPIDRALVFTRTKHGADRVVRGLVKEGIAAEAIHGNKSQGQRERVLRAFRQGQVRTLVATDIAARGIDVDGISHVFNFDLPEVPETYVHRIGRTARAGRTGTAISLCSADERKLLGSIEKLIRSEIAVLGEPPVETARSTAQRAEGDRKQSPAKGKRKRRSGKGQARYNRRGTSDGDLSTMPFLKPAQRGRRVADGRSAGAR